jgi:hypothetical protein
MSCFLIGVQSAELTLDPDTATLITCPDCE